MNVKRLRGIIPGRQAFGVVCECGSGEQCCGTGLIRLLYPCRRGSSPGGPGPSDPVGQGIEAAAGVGESDSERQRGRLLVP